MTVFVEKADAETIVLKRTFFDEFFQYVT